MIPARFLRRLAAAALAALSSACSPVELLNSTIPTAGLIISKDIAYGSDARQTLDVYRPAAPAGELPVVVFFYGGSWQTGSKNDYLFAAAALARRGLVVVVPDYRVYPAVRFPVFIEDSARAVVWAQRNIISYGGNPSEMFLMGHSAGAYNVVMLALDPKYLQAAGADPNDIKATIGLSGPYDFLPFTEPDIRGVFSSVDDKALTQPITYADGHNKPLLLLQGQADTTVYPRNTAALAAKIRAHGGPVEDKFYPGLGHVGMMLAFTPWFRSRAPVLDDVSNFIFSMVARDVAVRR
jgi:acetyl esterase/lipase